MVLSPVGRIQPKLYTLSFSEILVSSPASLEGDQSFAQNANATLRSVHPSDRYGITSMNQLV